MVELCKGVGCNITDKLTSYDFIQTYTYTIHHGDVKYHPDFDIPPKIVSIFKRSVKMALQTKRHSPLKPAEIKICLLDLYLMDGLMSYIEQFIKTDEATKKELEKDVEYLKEYYGDTHKQHWLVEISVCDMLKTLTLPTHTLYTLHYELNPRVNHKKFNCSSYYYLKSHLPVKKHINIDNHWRPIFLVQHPAIDFKCEDTVIEDCEINTELLKEVYHGSKTKLPVYIQSHALDRLCERLFPINITLICNLIEDALFKKVQVCYFNHRILLEVSALFGKLGYFVAKIIDEKIVLKTFLLLSNNSTPEGTLFYSLPDLTNTMLTIGI
ncbi:hypothetical protein [Saccharicrinis sp. GN24d3]|uniref:hypothetical protein n=1 Tax=Saccharicrinis sp. GN24d3 TaxID=3458416 RepID=UPI004036EFA0